MGAGSASFCFGTFWVISLLGGLVLLFSSWALPLGLYLPFGCFCQTSLKVVRSPGVRAIPSMLPVSKLLGRCGHSPISSDSKTIQATNLPYLKHFCFRSLASCLSLQSNQVGTFQPRKTAQKTQGMGNRKRIRTMGGNISNKTMHKTHSLEVPLF